MRANFWRILLTGTLLASIAVVLVAGGIATASPETVVAVDPKITSTEPGESFEINITVSDVSDLYGWEINMTFDPTILSVVKVTEGPFLKQAGEEQGVDTWLLGPVINNFAGFVSCAASFVPFPPEGATGSGVLASITFNVTTEGRSDLGFSKTKLNTVEEDLPVPLDHTAVDGLFAYPLLRDVAVINVEVSSTSVSAGESVSMNVTVKNEGEIAETFDVTVSYDSTIDTKTVTNLAPEASETLSFIWDTKGLTEGTYTITAVASILTGETETADNTYSEVNIIVTAPPPTTPTELFVGIIVAAIAASAVIFLYIRGRRSTKA